MKKKDIHHNDFFNVKREDLVYELTEELKAIHKYNPKYIFLNDTSAVPVGFAIKEAWKQAYPNEKPPIFYRIDPRQIMFYDQRPLPSDRHSPTDYKRISAEKKTKLEDFFKKRITDKNAKILVYDEETISGESPGTIVRVLTNPKRFGLSEEIKHTNIKMVQPVYLSDKRLEDYTDPNIKGVKFRDFIPYRSITQKSILGGIPRENKEKLDYNFQGTIVREKRGKNTPRDFVKIVKLLGKEAGQELSHELGKKRKDLEQRISALFSISAIISSLFFFGISNTGSAIGIFSKSSLNIIGIILFIAGLSAGFYLMYKRKR